MPYLVAFLILFASFSVSADPSISSRKQSRKQSRKLAKQGENLLDSDFYRQASEICLKAWLLNLDNYDAAVCHIAALHFLGEDQRALAAADRAMRRLAMTGKQQGDDDYDTVRSVQRKLRLWDRAFTNRAKFAPKIEFGGTRRDANGNIEIDVFVTNMEPLDGEITQADLDIRGVKGFAIFENTRIPADGRQRGLIILQNPAMPLRASGIVLVEITTAQTVRRGRLAMVPLEIRIAPKPDPRLKATYLSAQGEFGRVAMVAPIDPITETRSERTEWVNATGGGISLRKGFAKKSSILVMSPLNHIEFGADLGYARTNTATFQNGTRKGTIYRAVASASVRTTTANVWSAGFLAGAQISSLSGDSGASDETLVEVLYGFRAGYDRRIGKWLVGGHANLQKGDEGSQRFALGLTVGRTI